MTNQSSVKTGACVRRCSIWSRKCCYSRSGWSGSDTWWLEFCDRPGTAAPSSGRSWSPPRTTGPVSGWCWSTGLKKQTKKKVFTAAHMKQQNHVLWKWNLRFPFPSWLASLLPFGDFEPVTTAGVQRSFKPLLFFSPAALTYKMSLGVNFTHSWTSMLSSLDLVMMQPWPVWFPPRMKYAGASSLVWARSVLASS